MNITVKRENLKQVVFPDKCLCCLGTPAPKSVSVSETNRIVQNMQKPFSIAGFLLLFVSLAICGMLGGIFKTDLMAYFLFVFAVLMFILNFFLSKTKYSINIWYCTKCFKRKQVELIIERTFFIVFILSSAAYGYFYTKTESAYAVPTPVVSAFFISLFVLIFGWEKFHKFTPPVTLSKGKRNESVISLWNDSLAKELEDKNKNL